MQASIESTGGSDDPFETFGYFDPFLVRRVLNRFAESGIRFQIADASGVERWDDIVPQYRLKATVSSRAQRNDRIELFIHIADAEKARKILDQA